MLQKFFNSIRGGVNKHLFIPYTGTSSSQLLFAAFDTLRFPLAIAVVFIHMGPPVYDLLHMYAPLFSKSGIYNLMGVTLSNTLPTIAVPIFFFISGYLFFHNFTSFSFDGYFSKLRSRARTLLVPYVLWIVLAWLLCVAYYAFTGFRDDTIAPLLDFVNQHNFNIFYSSSTFDHRFNWLSQPIRLSQPYVGTLWFVRDLIGAVLLSPLVYFFLRRCPCCYLAFLCLAYLSRIWPSLPFFDITALFFFSLGASFALSAFPLPTTYSPSALNIPTTHSPSVLNLPTTNSPSSSLIAFLTTYRLPLLILSSLFLVGAIIYNGSTTLIGQRITPFYVLFGVFAALSLSLRFVQRRRIVPSSVLIAPCFFIYALHLFPIPCYGSLLALCKFAIRNIFPSSHTLVAFVEYLAAPLLCTFIAFLLYYLLKRLFPRFLSLLTGNR